MKKRSVVLNEKDLYNIKTLINNTAYIVLPNGETGLLNIRTNQLLGNIDNFTTMYDLQGKLYRQIKTVKATDERGSYKVINLYDALEEKMIADNWEIATSYYSDCRFMSLKSPIDGKIHFLDFCAYRKNKDIFNIACDDVKLLYTDDDKHYFVFTCGTEKGIYYTFGYGTESGYSFMGQYDSIDYLPNIIVFTKNGKCNFIYNLSDELKQMVDQNINFQNELIFNKIVVDEKNHDIIYCQTENSVDVYHTAKRKCLLHFDENVKLVDSKCYNSNFGYSTTGEREDFYFLTSNNSKVGLVKSSINRRDDYFTVDTISLLDEEYDDIKIQSGAFSFSKDGKVGFLKINQKPEMNHFIEANYDKIKELGNGYYVLYNDGYCDIGLFKNGKVSTVVEKCQLEGIYDRGLIYRKDKRKKMKNKSSDSKKQVYGLLLFNRDNFTCYDAEFDMATCVNNEYFVLEKKGKKGVVYGNDFIIPLKFKDISIGLGPYHTYFALKNQFNQYSVVEHRKYSSSYSCEEKIRPAFHRTFKDVSFFNGIMVLKDSANTHIYSYERDNLKTLSGDVDVVAKKVPNQFRASVGDKEFPSSHSNFLTLSDYIYCINGTSYFYTDGVFCEICKDGIISSNKDCYMTTYEADDCIYQIKTTDKSEHDSFCEYIDNQDDEVADIYLDNMSCDSEALHEQYPTLVLKKVKKNN